MAQPALEANLRALLQEFTAGDPMREGVLWTNLSLRELSRRLLALGTPAIMAQVGESLPIQMRSGGIGLIYAVAISVFGGTASLVVTWLTAITGSPLAPAGYMCAALALGVLSMLTMRETAPIKTGG